MVFAAIVQFCARHNVKDNTLRCVDAIKCAAGKGAKVGCLRRNTRDAHSAGNLSA